MNPAPSRLLVDYDMLRQSPTMRANSEVTMEHELANRRAGALLINNAAVYLGLGEDVIYHAQFLFQRFYYVESMQNYPVSQLVMALLFLSAKLNEQYTPGGDVFLAVDRAVKHYHHLIRTREFNDLSYLLTQAKENNLDYVPGIGPVTAEQIQVLTDTIEEYKQYSPDNDLVFLQHPRVSQALAMLAPLEMDVIQKLAFKVSYPRFTPILSDLITKLELPPVISSKALSIVGLAHYSPVIVTHLAHTIVTASVAIAASLHGYPLAESFIYDLSFEDIDCKVKEGVYTLVWMSILAQEQKKDMEYPCPCSTKLKSIVEKLTQECGVEATPDGYVSLNRMIHDDEVVFDRKQLSVEDQEQICYWMTDKLTKEAITTILGSMSEENYRYLPVSDQDAYSELCSIQLADVKAELFDAYGIQPMFDLPPI